MAEIKTILTPGAPTPVGHYSQALVYGGLVYVSGQLGIDPKARDRRVGSVEEQTNQALLNISEILKAAGSDLGCVLKMTVYVTDMARLRPLVNKVQEELWGGGPYPPRTIVEVARLNQDDIFEVEGTFYAPEKG